jgi:hypothetical protein
MGPLLRLLLVEDLHDAALMLEQDAPSEIVPMVGYRLACQFSGPLRRRSKLVSVKSEGIFQRTRSSASVRRIETGIKRWNRHVPP